VRSRCLSSSALVAVVWIGCSNSSPSQGGASSGGSSPGGGGGVAGDNLAGHPVNDGGHAAGGSSAGGSSAGGAATGGSSNGGAAAGGAPPITGTTLLPSRSEGCGKAASGAGTYVKGNFTIAGKSRDTFVRLPSGYDSNRAYPLLFQLHGSGGVAPGNGRGIEVPANNDAVIVTPQGIGGLWLLGATGDDVAFWDALYADAIARFCIDQRRVFVMGFSRGGAFSNMLGCVRGDRIRAVGPLASWHPARMGTCVGQPAAWFVHATNDSVVPLPMGLRARDYYIASSRCTSTTTPTVPAQCQANMGCDAGAEVVFCEIPGDHGSPIEWEVPAMWNFFERLAPR
jgi:polyhydroxybutyrate depolymerase